MHFLAIDPASSTGYAKLSITDQLVSLDDYGIIEVKNNASEEFSTVGKTCNELYDKIEALLEPAPEIVYIDNEPFARGYAKAAWRGEWIRAPRQDTCHLLIPQWRVRSRAPRPISGCRSGSQAAAGS